MTAPILALAALELVAARVELGVRHPLKTVRASSTQLRVELSGDPDALAPELRGRVVLPVRSLASGNGNRDSNMWRALGYPAHREIVLAVERVIREGEALAVEGRLTLRGVERPVRIRGVRVPAPGSIGFRGRFVLRMSDWGVPRPSLLLMKVEDEVDVQVELTLRRTPLRAPQDQ